jgi:hypothetical protein
MRDLLLAGVRWIPLSISGLLFLCIAYFTLRYLALQQHDRLLLAACAGGILVFLMLALTVLGIGIWLRFCRMEFSPAVEAVETIDRPTGLILPLWVSIPCILVDIHWLNCDGVQVTLRPGERGLLETIRSSQRLRRSKIIRQFEVSDLFGLCRVKFCRTLMQTVRIEPFPASATTITQIRRDQQGDDFVHPSGKPYGDLIEMRHYRPGDPLKLVLWKHYARTGQLLVRQPENSIACMSQTIACFVSGPGDQASAGVARAVVTALEQSGEGLFFQADGSPSATDDSVAAIDQIIHSVDFRQHGGSIVTAIATSLRYNALRQCIAFVPSQPGLWIDRLLAGQAAGQLTIDAIIGIDANPPLPSSIFPRWALRQIDGSTSQLEQVQTVVQRLLAGGISTKVIDRRSGKIVSTVTLPRAPR